MADYIEDNKTAPGRSKPQTYDEQQENDFFSDSEEAQKGARNRMDTGLYRGQQANLDENFFKKQMEFKQGKLF